MNWERMSSPTAARDYCADAPQSVRLYSQTANLVRSIVFAIKIIAR